MPTIALDPENVLDNDGTSNQPKRTLKWELGVDAKFESGEFEVPSFPGTFLGSKTVSGSRSSSEDLFTEGEHPRGGINPPTRRNKNPEGGFGRHPYAQ